MLKCPVKSKGKRRQQLITREKEQRLTHSRSPRLLSRPGVQINQRILTMLFCKTMHYSLTQDFKNQRHLVTTAKEN